MDFRYWLSRLSWERSKQILERTAGVIVGACILALIVCVTLLLIVIAIECYKIGRECLLP